VVSPIHSTRLIEPPVAVTVCGPARVQVLIPHWVAVLAPRPEADGLFPVGVVPHCCSSRTERGSRPLLLLLGEARRGWAVQRRTSNIWAVWLLLLLLLAADHQRLLLELQRIAGSSPLGLTWAKWGRGWGRHAVSSLHETVMLLWPLLGGIWEDGVTLYVRIAAGA